jgi:hypothetical protein
MSYSAIELNVLTGGTGAAAAPPDKSVQFNNSGNFGGDANFTFDLATYSLTLGSGRISTCGVNSLAIGNDICNVANNTIAAGCETCICAGANNSIAVGCRARVRGEGGASFGRNTLSEARSISAGDNTRACCANSLVVGSSVSVCAANSIGFGSSNRIQTSGPNSIVGGRNSTVCGRESIAVGLFTYAIGRYSAAFNNRTCARGENSASFGYNNISVGNESFTMGCNTYAGGEGSFAGGVGPTEAGGYNIRRAGRLKVRADGFASFNFSFNTTGQQQYTGNCGRASAILGGCNHSIASTVCNAAIIGGYCIRLDNTTFNHTTAVRCLAILGSLDTSGSNNVLVWDSSDCKIKVNTSLGAGGTGEINSGINCGSGVGLFRGKGGVNLCFKSLVGGTNTTITQSPDSNTLTIATTGEGNTGQNIGTGDAGVYASKSGVALQFRRIAGGSNVNIVEGTNTITVNSTGEANTASSLGGGCRITAPKSGVNLPFKSLVAGSNITLNDNGNEITINSTAGGGSGEANTSSNLGSGFGLAAPKSGVNLPFKSIVASCNISISSSTNEINVCALPSGTDHQVQFNDNNVFGANSSFCFNNTSNSVTIGTRCGTQSSYSLTVGCNNVANGTCSFNGTTSNNFAQGLNAQALRDSTHARGIDTCAIGSASTAEGCGTYTSIFATGAHAEGNCTCALAERSHAEGFCTVADESGSHVQNIFTLTCNGGSHAGGIGISSRPIIAGNIGAFIHSGNNGSAPSNAGNFGCRSAILGGMNHHIPTSAQNAVILGACGICLCATHGSTTAVGCLAIFCTPTSSSSTDFLVWDSTDKKIKRNSSVGGSDFDQEQALMTPISGVGHGASRDATQGRRETSFKSPSSTVASGAFVSTTAGQQGSVLRRLTSFSSSLTSATNVVFLITLAGRFLNWVWMTKQSSTTSTSRTLVGSPHLIAFGGDGHMASLMFFDTNFNSSFVYDIRSARADSNGSVEFGPNFTNSPLANQSDGPRPNDLEDGRVDVLVLKANL